MVRRTAITPFLLMALLITGIQCHDKIESIRTSAELLVLVDSFAAECSRRRISVDIAPASLQVGFGRIAQSGSCKPNSHPKVITIDSMIWKALSQPVREMLMYHELAHCLLERTHSNDMLPSGECKSWMREDDTKCKINSLNAKWRQHYIEELFSPEKLQEPDWYKYVRCLDSERTDVTPGKISVADYGSLLFDSSFFNGTDDWEIELRIPQPKKLQGYVGIKINEYMIHLDGFISSADTSHRGFIKTVMLDQFRFRQDKNILFSDTLKSSQKIDFEFTIRKIKKTVRVFFENDLLVSIPFENSLGLSGYYFSKSMSPYTISVYTLGSRDR